MRKIVCTLFLIVSPLASGQDLTEKEVLQRVSSESVRAKALAARVDLARAMALTEGLPPNGSFAFSRETAGTADSYLLYEQPLPVTGRRDYLRRAAMASAEGEAMSVGMQLHDLRVDARLAFLELLLTQEQLKLYDTERARLNDVVDIIRKREKAGESSGYDVIRAEREISLFEAEQGGVQARMKKARGLLASFLAAAPSSLPLRAIGTLDRLTVPDLATLIGRSENRGDIQAERRMEESSLFSMEAASRKKYPEPVVGGGLKSSVISGDRDSGYVVSVSVPLPFFDRGKAEMMRADAARRAARARADALRTEAQLKLKGAWDEMQTRIGTAEIYRKKAVTETGDLVRIARAAYEGGEVGILELLDAYRTRREVSLRMLELDATARQSALELERLVGEEVIK